MNDFIDKINSVIGPMIIPLPISNKYYSSIVLSDYLVIHNIRLTKQNEILSLDFMANSSIDSHKYILDLMLKAPESMVLYNDITKKISGNTEIFQLHVKQIVGNKRFEYYYSTENELDFLRYLDEYIKILKDNNFDGLSNELNRINDINGIDKNYKLMTKRKTLIK